MSVREDIEVEFLNDLRLLEERKTSPEWIATKYLYDPRIAILSEDQKVPWFTPRYNSQRTPLVYREAQQDMLDANFKGMRILTDEEDGVSPFVSEDFQEAYEESILKPICIAQAKETCKEIGEWGIEICNEHYKGGGVISRRECPECWKALLRGEMPEHHSEVDNGDALK